MLTTIEEAENVAELDTVAGWRLHPLKGDRKGVWSLKLSRNHRLTFRVEGSVASEIDLRTIIEGNADEESVSSG